YIFIVAASLVIEWRSRMALALATGLVLFIGGKIDVVSRWPSNRVVAYLGRTSYSLFLIHFPVLIVVATFWLRQEWTSPVAAMAGVVFVYILSVGWARVL